MSVGVSGDTFVIGAAYEDSGATQVDGPADDESAADSGAAYVFQRLADAWQQTAYLKANDAARGDYFGTSVAISGDTIAVGATHSDVLSLATVPTRSGAVYIFVRRQGRWQQQVRLDAGEAASGDMFGYHIALEGDRLVVGATRDGTGGGAYVFERSGETWSAAQKLQPNELMARANFGCYVQVSGDTIAIGAQNDSSAASNAGAVYVFVKQGDVWQEQQRVVAEPARESANFGYGLGLYGDRLVVGAPRLLSILSFTSVPSGEAFVFERRQGRWSQMQLLKATEPRSSDYFGASVSLNATTIAIGAIGDPSSDTGIGADPTTGGLAFSGAVQLFGHDGKTWRPSVFIKATRPGSNYLFGFAMALSAEELVVSSINDDGSMQAGQNGPSSSGAAYVVR
jgi:hypothetical protein